MHHRTYNPSVPFWVVVPLLVAMQAPRPAGTTPVGAEFRVFDGLAEVTASTRIRILPAGQRDADSLEARGPDVPLLPAIYDVEAHHADSSGVVRVKRAERLAIVHYPDEGARHLEVINFQPGFGALQLRAANGRLDIDKVALFRAGDRSTPAAKPIAGPDYVLFVVPADRYDVRVQHAEHAGTPDTHWLVAVDVPADGMRLKLVPQP